MARIFDADFDVIKEDLKTYLKSQDELKDYNFEGSVFSILLNTLAYSTQYNLFFLNMVANELFLETAESENNIHKLATQLNYLPKRKSSASITVNLENTSGSPIVVPAYTTFLMGSIYLTNLTEITVPASDNVDVVLNEGQWITDEFISDGTEYQRFLLEDKEQIDNDELHVYKYTYNISDGSYSAPSDELNLLNGSYIDVNQDNYFISYLDFMYLKFDNGTICVALAENDKIVVNYLKTNGSTYNGSVSTITFDDFASADDITITTTNTLQDGTDEEDLEQIKITAPQFYVTNNRAVTEEDYIAVLQKYSDLSAYSDIIAWGGEKEFVDGSGDIVATSGTEDIGHIYLTGLKSDKISHPDGTDITNIESFLDNYKIMTLLYKYKYSNILYVQPDISIKLNSAFNTTQSSLKTNINENFLDSVVGYRKSFNKSNLIKYIDSLESVDYCDVDFTTKIKYYDNQDVCRVWDEIVIGSISGIVGAETLSDSDNGDGTGDLNLSVTGQVGTIYYATGEMFFTHTFGEDIEITFEYDDKTSFKLYRETFLDYEDYSITFLG